MSLPCPHRGFWNLYKVPPVLHNFYCQDESSEKPSLKRTAISSLSIFTQHTSTHTHALPQTVSFHIGQEVATLAAAEWTRVGIGLENSPFPVQSVSQEVAWHKNSYWRGP